jgi:hypothetical protein
VKYFAASETLVSVYEIVGWVEIHPVGFMKTTGVSGPFELSFIDALGD